MKLILSHYEYKNQWNKYESYLFGFSLLGQAKVYKNVYMQCEREFLTRPELLSNLDWPILGLFEAIGSFGGSLNLFLRIGYQIIGVILYSILITNDLGILG